MKHNECANDIIMASECDRRNLIERKQKKDDRERERDLFYTQWNELKE